MDLHGLVARLKTHSTRVLWTLSSNDQVRQMSFGELHRGVDEAVRALQARGVSAGMRIGILAENCPEWIIHDLALITLGCTSVAFPRELAEEHWHELCDRFDLSLMLVSTEETLPLSALSGRVHVIDGATPANAPALAPRRPHRAADFTPALAFSSGSTGKSKCMSINPAGIGFDIERFYSLYGITAADRLLVFLPFSHYQQRQCVYAAIWLGMDIALVRPQQLFAGLQRLAPTLCLAPPLLYETLYGQFHSRVDKLPAPARLAFRGLAAAIRRLPEGPPRRLMQRLAYGGVRKALGGSMRAMSTGMAPIKRDVLEFFLDVGVPVYEAYGTGETGLIAANAPGMNRPGSVGKLIAEGIAVLAEDGEIIVRNKEFASRGYLDVDDGAARERFLPMDEVATGDIGSFDDDGFLYLIGRKKEIIITSNGLKIHPELVEARLTHHNLVERAAVFGSGMPYLVAVIVPRVPGPAAQAAIRDHVQAVNKHLSTGTQVGRVVFSSESFTPDNRLLTRTLKLNRPAIMRRFAAEIRGSRAGATRATSTTYVAPRRALEQQIAEIWRDVLEVESIGIHDHFFDLGGHSFTATQIVARLRSVVGGFIPLSIVFQAPTIAQLADALESLTATDSSQAPLTIVDRARPLPLSFAQERLWWESRQHPDIPLHSLPMIIRFGHECDIAALEHSIHELFRRHEPLRTRFPDRGGVPVQVIAVPEDRSIPFTDLSAMPAERQASLVDETLSRIAMTPFDLRSDLPVRLVLLKLDRADYMLVMVMHHIVTDGWSQEILAREFVQKYEAARRGHPCSLPELAHAHADFAAQQRAQAELGFFDAQVRYWQEQLRGRRSRIELPGKGPSRTLAGARCPVSVDRSLVDSAKAFSSEAGVTVFVTLLATFKAVLCRYSGQDDLCVGTPITGRHALESHGVVGLFINTLVLRSDLSGDPSFRELVARVNRTAIGAYANQDVPFEKMAQELWADEGGDHEPLFNVMLILQNPQQSAHRDQIFTDFSKIHTGIAVYDITLSLQDDGNGLSGWIDYRTESWDEAFIAGLMREFVAALATFTRAPDARLSKISPQRGARDETAANMDGQVQA